MHELFQQFREQLKTRYSVLRDILLGILGHLVEKTPPDILGLDVDGIIDVIDRVLVSKKYLNAYYLFDKSIESFTKTVSSKGYGVVAVDELQNLLKTMDKSLDTSILVKRLMDLQEHLSLGRVRFLLVTSDYSFYKRLLLTSYMEYIRPFYLGEMCRSEAIELFTKILELEDVRADTRCLEEYIDLIGGLPTIIYEISSRVKGRECREFIKKALSISYKARLHHLYIVLGELVDLVSDEIKNVLKKILDSPLEVASISLDRSTRIVIESLVKHNILQYACSSFVGIYEWDNTGGGECYLDVIAPSNRLYHLALCRIYGVDNPLCKYRLEKIGI